jgi:cytochrome c biogenesis protein CcmG, thiol:disulfide interchange protein DsbE
MRIINSTPFLVFLAIILALYYSMKPSTTTGRDKLATLELQLLSGDTLDLKEFAGESYIIHLFASWCGNCKDDLPYLKEIQNQTQTIVIGLAVKDKESRIRALSKQNLPYNYIATDQNMAVAKLLRTRSIPETIIINPEGKIIFRYIGGLDRAVVQDQIIPGLNKIRQEQLDKDSSD